MTRILATLTIALTLMAGTPPAQADDPTPSPSLVEALRVGLAQAGATSTSTDDTVFNVGSVVGSMLASL